LSLAHPKSIRNNGSKKSTFIFIRLKFNILD
jgi:hypothetical protein